ncbi:hypothetical protein DNK01_09015 [Stutzerimonas kirkiae]|nr:hypothetical protein DNK01_09015 [Stutzerimonas kirkiae]
MGLCGSIKAINPFHGTTRSISIRNNSWRVCLRLPAYSASAKVICFIGKLGGWNPGSLPKSGSLLQSFPTSPDVRDQLLLGNDIAVENLWFAQEGNDLSVSLAGTQDAILIKGWYSDDSSRIEEFSSADGRTLLDSRVQVLVDAMAAFAVPAGGESAMTPDLRAQLDVLIAANWQ